MRRAALLLVVLALAASSCSPGSGGARTINAQFSRAVQLFPGVRVRVLGVDVGVVTAVRNAASAVEVEMRIDDADVRLPAGVRAAIVPQSLLGERYVQLFPAYGGGAELGDEGTIPLARTAVPSEPDELLASLQDYLGALDPEAVDRFVRNAADVLRDNGDDLNRLIEHAAGVEQVLAAKRDDLAELVVQLDRVTVALASRQEGLGRLIRSYNTVARTLNENRAALEGTVTGLAEAMRELASLLVEHRVALGEDIDALAMTGRTLDRNVHTLARSARWSADLFEAAGRAIDFEHDWLRLNNQGEPLAELILTRLRERLVELCLDVGAPRCAKPAYWSANVPALFCFEDPCARRKGGAAEQLRAALEDVPNVRDRVERADRRNGGNGTTGNAVEELLENTIGREGEPGGTP